MIKKINIDKSLLKTLYVDEDYSKSKLANHFECSVDTISSRLKEYGITKEISYNWLKNSRVELNDIQLQIINGALLGDGHLTKIDYKHKNSQFTYVSSIKSHTEYIHSFLGNVLVNENKQDTTKYSYEDKRTNKIYTRYTLRSILNEIFTEMRIKWYPIKDKIIPKDLKITPLICLIWYIGDGSLISSSRSQYIKLCTNCFDLKDINDILIPQLAKFDAKPMKTDNNQYFIYIPHRKIEEFLKYIGECPFKEYSYKWEYKYYINTPPKNYKDGENQDENK